MIRGTPLAAPSPAATAQRGPGCFPTCGQLPPRFLPPGSELPLPARSAQRPLGRNSPRIAREGGATPEKRLLSLGAVAFLTRAAGLVNRTGPVGEEKALRSSLGDKFSFSIIIF